MLTKDEIYLKLIEYLEIAIVSNLFDDNEIKEIYNLEDDYERQIDEP